MAMTRSTRVLLPKTGSTVSQVNFDDGYYQSGSLIDPRFIDNGDGTITDRATNLMWVKQPERIIPGASVLASNQTQVARGNYANTTAYSVGDVVSSTGYYVCVIAHTSNGASVVADLVNNPLSWRLTVWTASAANLITPATMIRNTGITNCEALEYAGHTDWRLPNAFELFTIVNFGAESPASYATFFPNTMSSIYWSSTPEIVDLTRGKVVDFSRVVVGRVAFNTKEYIRPVRYTKAL